MRIRVGSLVKAPDVTGKHPFLMGMVMEIYYFNNKKSDGIAYYYVEFIGVANGLSDMYTSYDLEKTEVVSF